MKAEGRFIASNGPTGGNLANGALLLLFAKGQRPDARALAAAVEKAGRLTITHEIAHPSEHFRIGGCELLRDGMTYDLVGFAPGAPVAKPAAHHQYGVTPGCQPDALEALSLAPGPHLAAGARSMPVVRTQAGIAVSLAKVLPQITAVGWPPARTVIGAEFFTSSVEGWLAGGAFPSLGYAAFAEDPEGGMVTEGLAWFTGQELRFSNDIAKDRVAAARLGVRLVNQLVSQGTLTADEYIVAPDGGRLALELTRDGRTVRVRHA